MEDADIITLQEISPKIVTQKYDSTFSLITGLLATKINWKVTETKNQSCVWYRTDIFNNERVQYVTESGLVKQEDLKFHKKILSTISSCRNSYTQKYK